MGRSWIPPRKFPWVLIPTKDDQSHEIHPLRMYEYNTTFVSYRHLPKPFKYVDEWLNAVPETWIRGTGRRLPDPFLAMRPSKLGFQTEI